MYSTYYSVQYYKNDKSFTVKKVFDNNGSRGYETIYDGRSQKWHDWNKTRKVQIPSFKKIDFEVESPDSKEGEKRAIRAIIEYLFEQPEKLGII